MKILCIGETSMDISINSKSYPLENTKTIYNECKIAGGGMVPNIATFLGNARSEVYLASAIGNDNYGENIKRELEKCNVNTEFVETSFQNKSNMNIILYNEANKTNTISAIRSDMQMKKYSFSIIPDIIVADGTIYGATLATFDKYKDSKKILLVNEVTREGIDLMKYVDQMIFSLGAALSITKMNVDFTDSGQIVNLFNSLKSMYSNKEIIIDASYYGCIYELNGEIKIIPSINIDRVDMSCSYDAFVGGYIYAISNNTNIESSIVYGLIASSLASSKVGGRETIPKIEEIIEYYNSRFNPQGANNANQQNTQA